MLKSLRKPAKKRALRIFFATDVHGSDVCFRKFLAAANVYEADVLLLGGDFAGKGLVPVLRDGDGWERANPTSGSSTAAYSPGSFHGTSAAWTDRLRSVPFSASTCPHGI